MRILSLLFGTCLCTSTICNAQNLSGTVTDENNQPAPFANVLLFNASDSSLVKAEITDTIGVFSFNNTSKEFVFIEIQMIGLETFHSEPFQGGKEFNLIVLPQSSTALGEVTIKSQKPMFEKTGRGMIVNVESSPILSAGSTQDALEKVPGMVVNQDGSFTLKGKHNVAIYLDGKPTQMSQRDLALFLENTPASEIQKMEVFETPPAKFSAAGNAGIINIIRKKGTNLGFNGNVGVHTGYGNYHKLSQWLNGNYRANKFNVYGRAWYFNSIFSHFGSGDMLMTIDGQESSFYSAGETKSHPAGQGGRYGLDYSINDKTTIGYIGMLYSGAAVVTKPSTVVVSGPAISNYDFIDTQNNSDNYWFGNTHNLNFKKDISEGESLNFDVDYIDRGHGNENTVLNQHFRGDTPHTPNIVEQDGTTKTKIAVAKVDYEKTVFKEWAMETGAKASWVSTKQTFQSFIGTNASDVVFDTNASNNFDYDEAIYSSYLVFAKKWEEKWSIDFGARLEHTQAVGTSVTLDSTFTRSYTNLFPNVALSYSIPKKYSLSTAASRRIQRPSYHQLNPFTTQSNQFTFNTGNPYLKAHFTDVINFSWGLKEKFFFTISASQTLGQMTNVIDQQEDQQRQVFTVRNVDDFTNYNFNASLPIKIADWYTIHTNTTVYRNELKSDFSFGSIGYEITSFNLSMRHMISLPKHYKLELSGFYNYDSYWDIYFVEPHYQLDFGASKNWNKWRFTLALKDFLNIREGNGGVFQNTIKMPTTYKPESRKLLMNISYKFGNQNVKGERKRKTGSEDILQRTSD